MSNSEIEDYHKYLKYKAKYNKLLKDLEGGDKKGLFTRMVTKSDAKKLRIASENVSKALKKSEEAKAKEDTLTNKIDGDEIKEEAIKRLISLKGKIKGLDNVNKIFNIVNDAYNNEKKIEQVYKDKHLKAVAKVEKKEDEDKDEDKEAYRLTI